jgi:hypothetical protein
MGGPLAVLWLAVSPGLAWVMGQNGLWETGLGAADVCQRNCNEYNDFHHRLNGG